MNLVRTRTATAGRAAVMTAALSALALLMSGLMHAQAPTTTAPRVADRLPVKRVVLYKSGIGYFEHLGRVRGNQSVTIDFTSGQLDDVLKSLTTLDLDGGRVSGVSYNSEAALDRRLGALRLPVGQDTTRAQFLSALKGAKLDVTAGASHIVGRLLSVERVDRRIDNAVTQTDELSLVSEAGDIHTVALGPNVNVRILEADLNQEVGRYLSLLASARDQDLRRLTIATTGTGDRDLFVSYVSEVPVWKATYRLVLPTATETKPPLLQGWAIVDNTVGADWDNVELSLVAGAPQSFIQRISQPYYVQRPVVPLPERMSLTPQTHQAAIGTAGAGALAGTVTDTGGSVIPGATVRVTRQGVRVADIVTSNSGRYSLANVAPGDYELSFTMPGFRTQTRSGVAVTGGMETVMNATLTVGGANESVSVNPPAAPINAPAGRGGAGGGRGGAVGQGGGVGGGTYRVGDSATNNYIIDGLSTTGISASTGSRIDQAQSQLQADATAGQLGDLFEYKLKEPVTIRKNQSALVPILSGTVQADKVSLWNGSTGNRPLRAVWVTNSTGSTLDGGSFTVIEGQSFMGEGLIEPLKPAERRLLSYAVDLGVVVDAKSEGVPARVTRVQISRGVLIQQTEDRQRRVYTARNEDTEPRALVIEHPVRAGWTLGPAVTPSETTPAMYRFRVPIAAKTTVTFTVEETRPVQTQYAISNVTDDLIVLLVRDQAISAATEASLRQVIARKADIARLDAEIAARQGEIGTIDRDQDRVRENMKSLKGSSEERQLLQRYVKQLDDQENRLAALRKEVQALQAQRLKAQTDLDTFIGGMSTGG